MEPTSHPVKLSGAVMAHPKRMKEAQLIADADAKGRIRVTVDPEPGGRPTALRTALVSWGCVAPDATHHVVLQDDVLLADGFYEHAERVAARVPHEAVAFYAGWEARNGAVARLAALTGSPWAYTLQEHVPCQALMLPADVARGYAAFQEEHGEGWPYDVVVQQYLNSLGIPVRFTTPSTVQHDEVPSIAGNSYHGFRQATLFTGQAAEPSTYDCPRFPVVPFYQYGDARCAVRRETEWEYLETERYLRRLGLLDNATAAFDAAEPSGLPERVSRAVWLTGFATGVVTADAPEPEPSVAAAVMETLGTGGLCEEYTAAELLAMAPAVRDLALAALAAGRRAGRLGIRAASPGPDAARVVVTGGESRFGGQLARLLVDVGYQAVHLAGAPEARDLAGVPYVVHLGGADDALLDEVLTAAEQAGVARLVYAGSAAVYRGSGARTVAEGTPAEPPGDPVALAWWRQEERCRQWGERSGTAVQVLRLADPVGPHAPADSTPVRWVHLAWTRHSLSLNKQGAHQILDYRDMADAIGAVLAAPPAAAVLNVASAAYGEEELAELLADVSRRTPWEWSDGPEAERWTMSTELIEKELGWHPSASVFEGARALAQWYACDIHGDYDVPA
ncbi:NAD-dependent epimerase/dehydratase family protein [Streptomyces sp. NPDC000151]|uniref:NAD-dependent epimerase/dehydratase family protein n=1 Tax=Streptomyces sp. NPDC000151 TaxID=3154244 RepID=UPI00331C7BAE